MESCIEKLAEDKETVECCPAQQYSVIRTSLWSLTPKRIAVFPADGIFPDDREKAPEDLRSAIIGTI
jgi:hypothetical protein